MRLIDSTKLDRVLPMMALKSVVYFILLLLTANVLGRDPAMRPAALAISGLLTTASVVSILRMLRARSAGVVSNPERQ